MPVKKKAVVKKPKKIDKYTIIKEFCDSNKISYSEIHYTGSVEWKDIMYTGLFNEEAKAKIVLDWITLHSKITPIDPVEEVPLPPIQTEEHFEHQMTVKEIGLCCVNYTHSTETK